MDVDSRGEVRYIFYFNMEASNLKCYIRVRQDNSEKR